MGELLMMGRGSQNCIDDFEKFIREADCRSAYTLKFFWYVGKASEPVQPGGDIIGGATGSRQVKSFREHLPTNHVLFDGRPDGRARVIDRRYGVLRSAASFYYGYKSEVGVDKLLQDFTAGRFPDTHEELRLNMIGTNGTRNQNCYVHIYAVSNELARSVVYP